MTERWCRGRRSTTGTCPWTPPARHRRTVSLSSRDRRLEILDRIETTGRHGFRLAFHLGPDVGAELEDRRVLLTWHSVDGSTATAELHLSDAANWSVVRGGTDPVLGWYSAHFGEKQPAATVLGEGTFHGPQELATVVQFHS